MYLTVTCSETAARITEEDIVRETRDTLLSGELDAATPPHFASTALRSLAHSHQIVIRNAAHAY